MLPNKAPSSARDSPAPSKRPLQLQSAKASNAHYSLLTFDWSSQHGFNIGAIVGFFVAFSFVMTIVTPLRLVMVEFLMVLTWWATFGLLIAALPAAFKVGMPFLGAILVVLATAPTWREIAWFFNKDKQEDKWSAPDGCVHAWELREFAYKNEKPYLLDRIDKHYAAKAARQAKQLPRLAAGFVVATVINAVVGCSGRATLVWQLFNWSSGLCENLQGLIQIAAVVFGVVVFVFVAELSGLGLILSGFITPRLPKKTNVRGERSESRKPAGGAKHTKVKAKQNASSPTRQAKHEADSRSSLARQAISITLAEPANDMHAQAACRNC